MISDKQVLTAIPHVFQSINIPELGKKYQGKVRDYYMKDGQRILITTDRQSGFDINLGFIPYKGAVLNLLSSYWFNECKDIIPNHMISVPDPNVMIGKNCQGINVEMIVRGYLTGVTNTSPWSNYQKGERVMYGIRFPDGLQKNQKLPMPIITPTTHGGGKNGHDERLTRGEIIEKGIVSEKLYKQMEEAAFALFARGSEICNKAGLILVDTKYEFGVCDGKLTQIDEMHTPDSSRFWVKRTYPEKFERGEEPDNYDKEFIRIWYMQRVDPYKQAPPPMSADLIIQASKRYVDVYEKITGKKFDVFSYPIEKRIKENLKKVGII